MVNILYNDDNSFFFVAAAERSFSEVKLINFYL